MSDAKFSGGCQCGAVRYEYVGEQTPDRIHYCHCRMCQRAVGNVFATLMPVRRTELRWTGEPALFQSSSLASRGFCRACGTPLSFGYDRSEWICVTLGSLDDPAAFPPELHWGVESQVPWLHIADELPRKATEMSHLGGMINNQKMT